RLVGTTAVEEVANARCTDTDEHFNEVRTTDREERHTSFAGDSLSEQGLTVTRITDEQDALLRATTEPAQPTGVAGKVHDFHQLGVGVGETGDVGEGLAIARRLDLLGARLSELTHLTAAAAHVAHEPEHEDHDTDREQKADQGADPAAAGVVLLLAGRIDRD